MNSLKKPNNEHDYTYDEFPFLGVNDVYELGKTGGFLFSEIRTEHDAACDAEEYEEKIQTDP